MKIKKISLRTQINKVIGRRVVFFSIAFMLIIIGLTLYDLSISIKQLRSRINEKIKPIEAFAINQAMIDNLDTVELKIASFNENNPTFQIKWTRFGKPVYNEITWHFPFSWEYDYPINEIAGFQFGYFKLNGQLLADQTLIYDLIFRLLLLVIFSASVSSILYPLTKKIPEQLFINPINRFIDLVSNNSMHRNAAEEFLPIELEVLEGRILDLLETATEHERNRAAIELGHLSARLAHDICSPLAAMEMGLSMLMREVPKDQLTILVNGIQSVRDIANNFLERYRSPNYMKKLDAFIPNDNGNTPRFVLLSSLAETVIYQKQNEWHSEPCSIELIVCQSAKTIWCMLAPNDIKRLLSNLLNNSYDAILEKKQGIIHIIIEVFENQLHLSVKDNGIGISAENFIHVLNGESLKHIGNGLGLSGAKQYMEYSGGQLRIESEIGKGTSIDLIFPNTAKPTWFPSYISLLKAKVVIVLDDDFAMLMYWQQRITEVGISVKLFTTYEKALQWVDENKEMLTQAIFIVDYELKGDFNGLMFLREISDNKNRYLITSHAQEALCQSLAVESGVWLIPKSVIGELPLITE